jgi:hypothetical protein
MRISLLLSFLFLSTALLAQKPFIGTLKYQATIMIPDTNIVYKQWNVTLTTNDTIVRVETETEMFGNQVYIRNMAANKAYLLINMTGQGYAIQNDLSKKDSANPESQYLIKKVKGKKKIAGYKSQKYHVIDKGDSTGYDCYFTKKIKGKYLEVYKEIPYLATDYYIPSTEGLIHYELKEVKLEPVSRDMFGIPSDYKRITFDEFMNMFISGEGN